jgi:hypothetical protein
MQDLEQSDKDSLMRGLEQINAHKKKGTTEEKTKAPNRKSPEVTTR